MFHKPGAWSGRLAALAVAVLAGTIWFAAAPVHAATNTVVSLTFDDGSASQYSTLSMLSARGMNGTYYINSGLVGSSGYYMTWPQLHDLYNAGNEIGGHTVDHKNLTQLSTADATAEVCNDRTNLLNNGFSPVTSFAYPYAASNTSVEQIVQGCGYSSGRTVGNINGITPPPGPDTTPPATTISCNGAACSSGWYTTTPVTVSLSATDTGGSGVAQTKYTLDGSDPSTSAAAIAYTRPFTVSQTTTVRFYSVDVAGNAEQPKAQLIQIDAAAPAVSITAPAGGSSYKRGTSVTVSATATDNGTGSGAPSGVAQVVFRLD